MITRFTIAISAGLLISAVGFAQSKQEPGGGIAGAGIPPMTTVRVVSGLSRPLFVAAPRGDYDRLFILEQFSGTVGRIRILNLPGNTLNAAPYLSISPVSTGNEEGLLGLAFHPNFLSNGYFWVYYTQGGNNHIVRYQANAPYATSTTANAASATTLLTLLHPSFSNHNGGWMSFAPNDTNGYLYITTGDGGSANDPPGNAQNINAYLGKMLRLDVDGADNIPGNDDDDGVIGMTLPPYTSPLTNPYVGVAGLDELWAIGLRNPWRSAFDRANSSLYIGDVGQNAIEEIDYQAPDSGGSQAGKNYGWRCMEGLSCTGLTGCTCNSPALTTPILTYSHAGGACSITGGVVYRGPAIPGLPGTYFYADYCTAQIFTILYSGSGPAPAPINRTAELAPGGGLSIASITSFGEDAAGEAYIVDQGGEVFKILTVAAHANNTCATATAVGNVVNQPFSTVGASTEGPNEPASCNAGGYTQIGNDIWFSYTATCTGTAQVSLCGSSFDTKLAVYAACPTGPGQSLACSDDFCGTASEVTFSATQNAVYLIRIGGFLGATGNGLLTISCTVPACPGNIITTGASANQVDMNDMLEVMLQWGSCPAPPAACPANVATSGPSANQVDADDLLLVLTEWGPCS